VNYSFNPNTKECNYYEKDEINTFPNTSYLKFYPNNKIGYCTIAKSDTMNLSRNHFNPQNAKMGYYYLDRDKIKIKTSFIGQCELVIHKSQGKIVGDSIIQTDKQMSGFT